MIIYLAPVSWLDVIWEPPETEPLVDPVTLESLPDPLTVFAAVAAVVAVTLVVFYIRKRK